jgi:hypothetical protein
VSKYELRWLWRSAIGADVTLRHSRLRQIAGFIAALLTMLGNQAFADLSISTQTGLVSDEIKVDVPAWKRVDPFVSLTYAGNGKGVAGVSWSRKAHSTIVRVGKKGPLPNFAKVLRR